LILSSSEATAAASKGAQVKTPDAKGRVVSMQCTVYNGQRAQITYNNPSNQNHTCHSDCYYSANNGPQQTLSCTATAAAHTSNGFFCGSNSYTNVRITNPGSNNCP
jgi:nitrous oxide reductase accessory protein NosL